MRLTTWQRVRLTLGGIAPPAWAAGLGALLLAERDRWVLWAPPALGAGIGLYYALPREPALELAVVLLGICLVLVVALRRHWPAAVLATGLALVALGFAVATWRTDRVAAPVLQKRVVTEVAGRVNQIDTRDSGAERVTLDQVHVAGLGPQATPEKIRITLRASDPPAAIGSRIAVRANIAPPPEPVMPGAYDFARSAWYHQLGAVGYALGPARPLPPEGDAEPGLVDTWRLGLAELRHDITARIVTVVPGDAGAVAAALITGERSGISRETEEAYQASGLAHILSVSGLHIAIVSALLFFLVRGGLALIEPVALRYPTKKWAAVAAIAGTLAYTLIAGWQVAAVRSFLMSALVLVAIILDRNALSMRTVGWAALALLLVAPEVLLDASFQMSFSAVVALIAVYEASNPFDWAKGRPGRLVIVFVGGIGLTTLVAGFASAPFAAYHFNRFVDYGLLANLLAAPLSNFWIMPCAVLAMFLMPFGLEALGLVPMGWGIAVMNAIAEFVAGLPGAVQLVPTMPLWAILAIAAGGLWLCLWQRAWRWAGVVPILAGCVAPWFSPLPDLLVDGEARLIALRADHGFMLSHKRSAGSMVAETWSRRLAEEDWRDWPGPGMVSADGQLRCDKNGCLWRHDGRKIGLVRKVEGMAEACGTADMVVSSEPVRDRCRSPRLVIDRFDVWRRGAHTIRFLDDGRFVVTTVAGERGLRPWVRRRGRGG